MQITKKFSTFFLLLVLFMFGGFVSKVEAAANITIESARIINSSTLEVDVGNIAAGGDGGGIGSADETKWHIDVGGGGATPLTPTSYSIFNSATGILRFVFTGTPFSDTAKSYSASEGLYVDAGGVTDGVADTNVVIAHGASVAIADGQAPAFVSAEVTSDTNIQVTFSESVTVVEASGVDFDLTGNGVTITAATINADDTIVDLTTLSLGNNGNSYYTDGLDIAVDAVRDISPATNSSILTQNQDVDDGMSPETPTISPTAGTKVNALPQTTTISSVGSESIRYTIDGTTPNCSTGLTANPLTLTANGTVKAIGCDNQGNNSSVTSFEYVFVVHSGGSASSPIVVPTSPVPTVVNPVISITPVIGTQEVQPISVNISIPGCDDRTTGFSTINGVSCVGNNGIIANPTLSTPSYVYNFGTKILKNGSTGEAVKELQRFLNVKLNLSLVVDGKLGPKTVKVIKQWQKDNGLVADGLVGPKTKAMMNQEA